MKIEITYEGKKSLDDIRKQFEQQLSRDEIDKVTAKALNITATRSIGFIKKQVKRTYTVNNKYFERFSKVSKKANSKSLYADISFSNRVTPMIGFDYKGEETGKGINARTLSPIQVAIRKGKLKTVKGSFIATMRAGASGSHKGIFATGHYEKQGFVYEYHRNSSGKTHITELKSVSMHTMAMRKDGNKDLYDYVDGSLPKRLQALLQQQVNKIK